MNKMLMLGKELIPGMQIYQPGWGTVKYFVTKQNGVHGFEFMREDEMDDPDGYKYEGSYESMYEVKNWPTIEKSEV